MAGPFYFAWIAAPIDFDPDVHNVEDESILALKVAQDEGEFASLEIDIKNPGEGLLAPGHNQWCWLSWDSGVEILPLFMGRLVVAPERVEDEKVRLLFRAKPANYEDTKAALAETLAVLPHVDPVAITSDLTDPATIIKAYGAQYHTDRVTHVVTISDELAGEDGTIVIDDPFYDGIEINFADKPKKKWKGKLTLAWTQSGEGTIDLTERLYKLFREKKSIYIAPGTGVISSLTGDGLKSDWPKGGTSLDGGWTVNTDTFIKDADPEKFKPYTFDVTYQGLAPGFDLEADASSTSTFFSGFSDWTIKFPVSALKQSTKFDWKADRKRTEILEVTITADVQPVADDESDEDSTETVTISASDTVTEPDAVSGDMPIIDKRRAFYLPTDRGQYTVQYFMLLGRAFLRRSARVVECNVKVPFETAIAATLRQNADITDRRLPGGRAVGKIIGYSFQANGKGENFGEIRIGCAVGRNGEVAISEGVPEYVESGYVSAGYQQMEGAQVEAPTGDIAYESLNDFTVDDDGVDLTRMDEVTAVQSLTLTGGLSDQTAAVISTMDPATTLKSYPSRVCLQLVPVAGGDPFETTFTPSVALMPIVRGIDLEAPLG